MWAKIRRLFPRGLLSWFGLDAASSECALSSGRNSGLQTPRNSASGTACVVVVVASLLKARSVVPKLKLSSSRVPVTSSHTPPGPRSCKSGVHAVATERPLLQRVRNTVVKPSQASILDVARFVTEFQALSSRCLCPFFSAEKSIFSPQSQDSLAVHPGFITKHQHISPQISYFSASEIVCLCPLGKGTVS